MSTKRATLVGAIAVLLWGMLALFTTLADGIPPFQLTAMTFGIASLFVLSKWLLRREDIIRHLRQPTRAWLFGVCGLFGYHFFYFMALKNAPPLQAGLIAYMWPLLIVVGSALLPGEKLRAIHMLGAFAGLLGAGLLVTNGKGLGGFETQYTLGYIMAVFCALTWSTFSILNRRFKNVPTDTVGGFCMVTAALAFGCHLGFEETVLPHGPLMWLGLLGLGLGPVGVAFFAWDFGTKHGDIRVLGALSYMAPLISTLLLIAFGKGEATWAVAAGCILIIGGAFIASWHMLRSV